MEEQKWLDRLIEEQKLLQDKIDKLSKFLKEPTIKFANGKVRLQLMQEQLEYMIQYNTILKLRIYIR